MSGGRLSQPRAGLPAATATPSSDTPAPIDYVSISRTHPPASSLGLDRGGAHRAASAHALRQDRGAGAPERRSPGRLSGRPSTNREQADETIAKYREWYETLADGKTWRLGAPHREGASRDPRHTIRIGFVRDEEGNRVIVGFIGLYQRNRQS